MKQKITDNRLIQVLNMAKPVFITIFFFAFGVNLLMLITPMYSLQVLDRVISSQSQETLFVLSLLMLVLYIALHLIQVARSFTLIRLGEWIDNKLAPELFCNSIKMASIRSGSGGSQNLRDLEQVKNFLTSIGINTLFDAPWSIVYIIVLFVIHPWMGWLSVISAVIILCFAILNAYAINSKLAQANEISIQYLSNAEIATRNAEVVQAMGMMSAIKTNWYINKNKALEHQSVASYRNGIISNFSKFFRMVVQMLVTAIGAYLVLTRPLEMSVGGMIASSIMIGRALAPFDQAIEVWKQVTGAVKSYQRIKETFRISDEQEESMSLPAPSGRLSVENVFFAPAGQKPGTQIKHTVKGVSFQVEPGEIVAMIGPSAAGKSSLAKLIVGVWKPLQGHVRLDSADVYSWNRDDFGLHVGYLPQDVELFGGTIKQNIARMKEDFDPEQVVIAAQLSGAHEMILRLPNGYETDIGIGGANLSGGQRQRIGLARAFYGDPKLVVLDEPNANLDEVGEQALIQAMQNAKKRKITTIVISHRPSILSSVDKILIIQDGMVAAYGDRNDIVARFAQKQVNNEDKSQ